MASQDQPLLGDALSASPVATYVFDPTSFDIVEANLAAAAFYGYAIEDFLALNVREIIADAALEVAQRSIALAADPDRDNLHVHADGTPIPVWIHAFNVTVDGRTLRVCHVENLETLRSARVYVEQQLRTILQTVGGVLRVRDPYTDRHQKRVAALVEMIASELQVSDDERTVAVVGATVHDIGKISIPAEILTYPGRLSETSMGLVRTHSQTGHDLLVGSELPSPIGTLVLQHHERMDGSGYPNRLRGDEVHPLARIVAVADVAEAISSHRPYRPARPLSVAIDELEGGAGTRYDPDVVRATVRVLERPGFELHPDAFSGEGR